MIEQVKQALGCLKVFPLPSAILLPGGLLPLHIFEPRYRALVRDCLASDRVMAMALLAADREPGAETQPPTRAIACAGVIEQHEALPDGRFNILLRGICRVRLVREREGRDGYRQFIAEPVADAAEVEDSSLRSALLDLSTRIPPESAQPLLQMTAHARGGALADAIANAVISDPDELAQILGELSVQDRVDRVREHLSKVLENLPPGEPEFLN